jgi:ABC-type Na+ efflux pump permease subunit
MLGMILTPSLMLEEKFTKTMDALLVSPASASQLVAGKALAGLFFCGVGLAVAFAFNAALITQWWLAVLVAAIGSLMTTALGLLIGSIVETRQQASVLYWILIVAGIAPVALDMMRGLLPETAASIIRWMPTAVLARAYRVSFGGQVPPGQILPELAVLIGCIVIPAAAVAWVVRRSDR